MVCYGIWFAIGSVGVIATRTSNVKRRLKYTHSFSFVFIVVEFAGAPGRGLSLIENLTLYGLRSNYHQNDLDRPPVRCILFDVSVLLYRRNDRRKSDYPLGHTLDCVLFFSSLRSTGRKNHHLFCSTPYGVPVLLNLERTGGSHFHQQLIAVSGGIVSLGSLEYFGDALSVLLHLFHDVLMDY